MCAEWAPHYAGARIRGCPASLPRAADMAGLPPIVMQTAGDDPISVDADKIEAAVAASGTGILDHRRFANLWHDFHLQVSVLDEAREAVADLGAKLRYHISTPTETYEIHTLQERSQQNERDSKAKSPSSPEPAPASAGRWRSTSRSEAHKLALSDIDAEGLAETVRQAEALGADVKSDRLDVAEREAVLAYADAVVAHFGTVNQVYNNAGIAYNGDVEKSEFKDIERIMDVDFWGVVNGTKAFLPHVIASGDGHVVNISSLFGLIAVPGQSAYNAAKFAVRGFTEALRQEMLIAKHPVKVTCVHPGGIKTAVARNATVADGEDAPDLGGVLRQAAGHPYAGNGRRDHHQRRRQGPRPGSGRLGGEGTRCCSLESSARGISGSLPRGWRNFSRGKVTDIALYKGHHYENQCCSTA